MLYQNTPGRSFSSNRIRKSANESITHRRYVSAFGQARDKFGCYATFYGSVFYMLTFTSIACTLTAGFLHLHEEDGILGGIATDEDVVFFGLGLGLFGSFLTAFLGVFPLKVAQMDAKRGFATTGRYLITKGSLSVEVLEDLYKIKTPCLSHPLQGVAID